MLTRRDLLVRIKVVGECWEWSGALNSTGYGHLKTPGTRQNILAHRLSFILFNGELLETDLVLHKCDNRKCIRPQHLFKGDYADNLHDAMKKGRFNKKGENHHGAKLTEKEVLELRRTWAVGVMSAEGLSNRYGISKAQVYRIIRKERWK